ncbi:hypothetical protein E4U43_001673 [Claviceps pusilla]|uniref:Uncharacterized protein n=1 Tax=Claviceps pusilla TaxID=123648 RepID=A0A9P7N7E4_9HYPO|nr:hypothetical protein E4U43_001673 [Claviceps pusilla]
MAPWGYRNRSATAQFENEADQIFQGEIALRAHDAAAAGFPAYIIPRNLDQNLSELPRRLAGLKVGVPRAKLITNPNDLRMLGLDDPIFKCIAVAAQFGLDLLHSRCGFRSLKLTGIKILELRKEEDDEDDEDDHGPEPDRNMEPTQSFLQRTVEDFPVVIVRDLKGINGRTTKGDWSPDAPHQAAIIEINVVLVNMFIEALESLQNNVQPGNMEMSEGLRWERFRTILFRIGATIAHELCHIHTHYLIRDRILHTPPAVSYGPYTNEIVGESGRYWESLTFGGYIDMRMGSGMERVAVRHGLGDKTAIIGPHAIAKMVHRDFTDLPLLDRGGWEQEDSINARNAYDWKQKYGDIFPQEEDGQDRTRPDPEELSDEMVRYLLVRRNNESHTIMSDNLRSFALHCNAQLARNSNFSWRVGAAAAS